MITLAIHPIRALGGGALLCLRAWKRALRGHCPPGALRTQTVELTLRSLPLVSVCLSFIGAVVVVDIGRQIQPIVGNLSPLGPEVLRFLVREFGPTFTGLVVATRIGAGIAAELSAMSVAEQIDALRLCSADPVAELVAPRVVASFFGLLFLAAAGTLISALAGSAAAVVAFQARGSAFLDPQMLTGGDFAVAIMKSSLYGLAIPTIAAAAGLSASGGAPAVGRATTAGVVGSVMAVIALDLAVGVAAAAVGA